MCLHSVDFSFSQTDAIANEVVVYSSNGCLRHFIAKLSIVVDKIDISVQLIIRAPTCSKFSLGVKAAFNFPFHCISIRKGNSKPYVSEFCVGESSPHHTSWYFINLSS